MAYKLVPNSKGPAPRFAITVGLQEGYNLGEKTHSVAEVTKIIEAYLRGLAESNRRFLNGVVTTGNVVYAWPSNDTGPADATHEPVVVFSGEVNPLYNVAMRQSEIEYFLNTLAQQLGEALNQTRVYVAFDGQMWILQKEGSTSSAGDTV